MIDDFGSPEQHKRRKPKIIEPLAKTTITPLAIDDDLSDAVPNIKPTHEHGVAVGHFGEPAKGKKPKGKRHWPPQLIWSWPPTKKQAIIGGIALVVVLVGIGAGWTHFHHKEAAAVVTVKPHKQLPPQPTTVPSTLTGLPVDPSVNKRPVTAVMIENSPDARPQSGLDSAGVVFEALAEGGVTRFMALYQDTAPSYIGPIRSARPYYIEWAMGFDAGYAHVGGSPDGLHDIKVWDTRDLDQFYNAGSYHRISSRYAPHNVYTSVDTLMKLEKSKGYTSSNFTGFARKASQPYKPPRTVKTADGQTKKISQDKRTPANTINLTFSGYYYDSEFKYQPKTNDYLRYEAGKVHTELSSSGKKSYITPNVVVAMVVPRQNGALDTSGAYYSDYNAIGSGTAYVFQDGTVQKGSWRKTSRTAALEFLDTAGQPLKLNPGQTWISAIASSADVSYK